MKRKSKSKITFDGKAFRKAIPKDYPWKVVGWLLDDLGQLLAAEDANELRRIIRMRDEVALRALAGQWGLQSMSPTGMSLATLRARYQLSAILKKFRFGGDDQARDLAARDKFLAGEAACAAYNHGGYRMLTQSMDPWVISFLHHAKGFLQDLLGDAICPLDELTLRSRHGPGATTDTEGGQVSSFFKFGVWPYSCTEAARGLARLVISNDDRWLGALEDDYRRVFNIPAHAILNRRVFWDTVIVTREVANRICFVPKDSTCSRTIAIEPTLNLYLQLGVDGFIRKRLKRWGVDLDSQVKNQVLARTGSLEWDSADPFVTLDLANASNSISMRICHILLPACWYNLLLRLRTPCGSFTGEKGIVNFEMLSSMGNGYTFALESALFTAVIYGVMKASGVKVDPSQFAVFGDDLIIRQSLSTGLIYALALCGFTTNDEKSFLSGPCRESCGTDWFQGAPVRPVFLEDLPKCIDELWIDMNRLQRILHLRWSIEESKTLQLMARWIPEEFRDFVGPLSDEEFGSYRHVPCSPNGMNTKTWLYEYTRLVRQPIRIRTPRKKFLFRKLMHDLAPSDQSKCWLAGLVPFEGLIRDVYTGGWKLSGDGSRFSVVWRGPYKLSHSDSGSGNWSSKYAEVLPSSQFIGRAVRTPFT